MGMIDYNSENYYFGGIQEGPIGDPSIFPLSQEDIDKIVEDNGGSGTGGNIDPEQKEITCIENGVKIIEPSGDFDGLSSVKVTVDVPGKTIKEDTVELSATENGTVETSASEFGVDGLKAVSVKVNVPSPSIKPEPVSLTFSENRTYTISAEEYNVDGLSSVDVIVDVPSTLSATKFYYSNGFMSESDDTIITRESYSSGSSLVSVVIGSNVTEIADNAFQDNVMLSSVTLEGVESIGMSAFAGCNNLLYLTIPSSVRTIGNEAFAIARSGGNNIDITFESTIPVSLESGDIVLDLFGITGTYVTIPTIHVPEGFEEEYATHDAGWELIAQYITGSDLPLTTFYYGNGTSSSVRTLKLTSDSYSEDELIGIEIGEGVKIIGDTAFINSNLSSVTIPSSVVSIGTAALAIDDCTITFTTETPNVPLADKYGNIIEAFGGGGSTSGVAQVTIIVPSGCKANYVGSDEGWEYYANYIHEA